MTLPEDLAEFLARADFGVSIGSRSCFGESAATR